MIRAVFLATLVAFASSADVRMPPSQEYRTALTSMCNEVSTAFEKEYLGFIKTGVESQALKSLTALLTHSNDILRTEVEHLSTADQTFLCTACASAANVILPMAREVSSEEDEKNDFDPILDTIAKEFCVRLNIEPKHVCDKVIDVNLPVMLFIFRNNHNITAEEICGTLLQGSNCVPPGDHFDWKVNITEKKFKNILKPKSDIPSYKSEDKINILHLTDFHWDPNYTPGSLAECDEPMCCTTIVEDTPKDKQAGAWTDYRDCDISWALYEETLKHIASTHKDIDLIYFTGDVIHHGIWINSHESNEKEMKQVYAKLKETFGDIPILGAVGNHESQPLNIFAPPNVERHSTQWLYDYLAEEWSKWLPEDTKESIKAGGYYSFAPKPGFRVISINNNDAYTFNWWIWYDPVHLSKPLQWLHDELLKAEEAGEYVHILSHVPSGTGSTLNVWAREFRKIVERFHPIISGIFNGHTHFDELSVYYSMEDSKTPINVAWNGGSLTPFSNVNPNYRIYGIEPKTFQVVDHETYIFNLTEANLHPDRSPVWFKEYNFKEAYGVKDLSPSSIDQLLVRFTKDPELLLKYYQYKMKQGDPKMKSGCDEDCLMMHLCEAATTQYNDKTSCLRHQRELLKTILFGNSPSVIASLTLTLISLITTLSFR